MLVRQVITSLNRRQAASVVIRGINTTAVSAVTIRSTEEPEKPKRKLKEWRKKVEPEQSVLKIFDRSSEDKVKPLWIIRRPLKLAPHEIMEWLQAKKVNYEKYDQRFLTERHQALGCDLAAAHFLIFRGGKVKFQGDNEWKTNNEDGTYDLPTVYDPTWQLTHLDASGVDLYYEGIENFINLKQLTWASFRGNKHFDDWCLDKISSQFPSIEYLDVSECPKLTERGLEALYRLLNLKTLIITDWNKQPSFELTCAMLEDCNRQLNIEMQDPPVISDEMKNK